MLKMLLEVCGYMEWILTEKHTHVFDPVTVKMLYKTTVSTGQILIFLPDFADKGTPKIKFIVS